MTARTTLPWVGLLVPAAAPSSAMAGAWVMGVVPAPSALGLLGLIGLGLVLTALPLLARRRPNAVASWMRALWFGSWLAVIAWAGLWVGRADPSPLDEARAQLLVAEAQLADLTPADRLYETLLAADAQDQAALAGVVEYRDPQTGRRLPRQAAVQRAALRLDAHDVNRAAAAASALAASVTAPTLPVLFDAPPPRPGPLRLLVLHAMTAPHGVNPMPLLRTFDLVVIGLAAMALAWAFSPAVGLSALLFLLLGIGGLRWGLPGAITLDGAGALLVALSCLKKERGTPAGVALAVALLADPVAVWFFLPAFVVIARRALLRRRAGVGGLHRSHRPVVWGFLLAVVGLWGLCAGVFGPELARDALSGAVSGLLPSSPEGGWGLGHVLGDGGEGLWGPTHRALAVLSLGLLLTGAWRSGRPAWQVLWLGFLPLYAFGASSPDDMSWRVVMVVTLAASATRPVHLLWWGVLWLPEVARAAGGDVAGDSAALLVVWIATAAAATWGLQRRFRGEG